MSNYNRRFSSSYALWIFISMFCPEAKVSKPSFLRSCNFHESPTFFDILRNYGRRWHCSWFVFHRTRFYHSLREPNMLRWHDAPLLKMESLEPAFKFSTTFSVSVKMDRATKRISKKQSECSLCLWKQLNTELIWQHVCTRLLNFTFPRQRVGNQNIVDFYKPKYYERKIRYSDSLWRINKENDI